MSRFIVFFIINICLLNEVLSINGNTSGIQDNYHNLTSKEKKLTDNNLVRTKRDCGKGKLQRSKVDDASASDESADYNDVDEDNGIGAVLRRTKKKNAEIDSNIDTAELSKQIQNLIKLINLLIIAAENNMKMIEQRQNDVDSEEKPLMGARRIQTVENELLRKMSKRQKQKPNRRTTLPRIMKRNKEPHRKTVEWSEVASSMANKKKNNH